jgi:hypothetical protein
VMGLDMDIDLGAALHSGEDEEVDGTRQLRTDHDAWVAGPAYIHVAIDICSCCKPALRRHSTRCCRRKAPHLPTSAVRRSSASMRHADMALHARTTLLKGMRPLDLEYRHTCRDAPQTRSWRGGSYRTRTWIRTRTRLRAAW